MKKISQSLMLLLLSHGLVLHVNAIDWLVTSGVLLLGSLGGCAAGLGLARNIQINSVKSLGCDAQEIKKWHQELQDKKITEREFEQKVQKLWNTEETPVSELKKKFKDYSLKQASNDKYIKPILSAECEKGRCQAQENNKQYSIAVDKALIVLKKTIEEKDQQTKQH